MERLSRLRQFICVVLLLLPLRSFAATGDIVSVTVETNGWQALVVVSGLSTGGTYSYGLGSNREITGNEKLVLTLTSPGYTTNGIATTRTRQVVGTFRVRKTTPDQAQADETTGGGNVTLRVALSDWVFAEDSSITADVSAGFYTQGGTPNNAATDVVVTNNSDLSHDMQKPVANWTWPGFNRETNATMRVRAVGFHASAQDGMPLAAMAFIASDEGGNVVTNIQPFMQIVNDVGDALPFAEYVADFDLSDFDDGDQIRVDFVAYPHWGTKFDTRDNLWTGHTPLPTSITNLNDRLMTYTDAVAVVGTAGASPNVTNVPPASVNSAHYFGSIAAAVTAIASYNNSNFSHNDAGGATIYVKSGITAWTGGTHSVTAVPKARIVIANYPGDTVTLTTRSGTQDIGDRIQIDGIQFNWGSGDIPFNGIDQLWISDSPSMLSAGTQTFTSSPLIWITGSAIGLFAQGLEPVAAQNTSFMLRGANLNGFNDEIYAHLIVGSIHPNTNGPSYTIRNSKAGQGFPSGPFIRYNNALLGSKISGATFVEIGGESNITHGAAFVQNIVEYAGNSTTMNSVFIGTDDDRHYTNVIAWNNNIIGRRSGFGYNDSGTAINYRYLWSMRNMIVDVPGFKTDTHAETAPDANRVGDWPLHWGVSFGGNAFLHSSVDSAALSFPSTFPGIGSYENPGPTENNPTYPDFVDRTRANVDNSSTTLPGGGNYRLLSTSPLLANTVTKQVLPYDIYGAPRSASDPPGAALVRTYFVSKAATSSDSNDGLTRNTAWLTIQKAMDTVVAGDTVIVIGPDFYDESPVETTDGTASARITYLGENWPKVPQIRGNDAPYVTLKGFQFTKTGHHLWTEAVRLENDSHNWIIQSNRFGPMPFFGVHGARFSSVTNSIWNELGVNWEDLGFRVGQTIYSGGNSQTNLSGQYPFAYANHNTSWGISNITGNVMIVTNVAGWVTETNTGPVWAPIHGGGDKQGVAAVGLITSGGYAATNTVVDQNWFTNWYGVPFRMVTESAWNYFRSNRIDNLYSSKIFQPAGTNVFIQWNWGMNLTSFVHYSKADLDQADHTSPGEWWDYIQGNIHPGNNEVINAWIENNWLENVEAPLQQFSVSHSSTNVNISTNVFYGVQKVGGGGVDGLTYKNNTFVRSAYGEDEAQILSVGGSVSAPNTKLTVTRNIFHAIGDNSNTNNQTFYNFPYWVTTNINNNHVSAHETMDFQGHEDFNEPDGVNGGNPRFVDVANPRGPDGLPWTADDGLKVLPGSPAATLGAGALGVRSVATDEIVVSFALRPVTPGWYDQTGEDFDTAWYAADFWTRTNVLRPYSTPESLGHVPATVFLDASATVFGKGPLDKSHFIIDWGDGSVHDSWTATNTHTYLWPGTNTVTVTAVPWGNITNGSAIFATGSQSRTFRILSQTNSTQILHAKLTGNDTTGTGTFSNPYRTVDKVMNTLSAGGYGAIHSGDFAEWVDIDRNVASSRIQLHGFGAKVGGFQFRYTNWTAHGFDIDGSPAGPNAAGVYVHQDADSTEIINNFIHDLGGALFGGVYVAGSGDANPMTRALNGRIIGNTFSNISSPSISIFGGSNWLTSNFRSLNSRSEGDFIRPSGVGHTIQDGSTFNLNNGYSGGHPDFFQLTSQHVVGLWFKDIRFQRLYIRGLSTNRLRDSGAITLSKASGDNPVIASAPIFEPYMADEKWAMTIKIGSATYGITNYISPTQVKVNYDPAISSATFTIRDDDNAIAQIESGHFLNPQWSNVVVSDSIFQDVRGPINDSVDGLKVYNNLFLNTPKDVGELTTGGDHYAPISSISRSGTTATATTSVPHLFTVGLSIWVTNAVESNFNAQDVTVASTPTSTSFTYTVADTGATSESGGNIFAAGDRGSSFATDLKNNLMINPGLTSDGGTIGYYNDYSGTQAGGTTVTSDYNFITGLDYSAKDEPPPDGLDRFGTGGNEANSINGGNPNFANYALGDFRPTETSPFLDAGVAISGRTTDYFGNPVGSTPSMGPFQLAAGAEPESGDTTDPVVTITSPTSDPTYDNGTTATVTVSGTASDNVGVASVTLVMSGATTGSVTVTGTTTWTGTLANINVGTTTFTATATDAAGNSSQATLQVTRSASGSNSTGRSTPLNLFP